MAMSLPPSGEAGDDRYAPMAEINVTPMVDVMLVLLVIFMVTAPLLMVGVPLDLPKTQRRGDHRAEAADHPQPQSRRARPSSATTGSRRAISKRGSRRSPPRTRPGSSMSAATRRSPTRS